MSDKYIVFAKKVLEKVRELKEEINDLKRRVESLEDGFSTLHSKARSDVIQELLEKVALIIKEQEELKRRISSLEEGSLFRTYEPSERRGRDLGEGSESLFE